jgi:hypothetical protein
MKRDHIHLQGKALQLAQDIELVQRKGQAAYSALTAEFHKRDAELRARTNATTQELMDELFKEVGLDPADKNKWAADLRFATKHGFALLLPIDDDGQVEGEDEQEAAVS